MILLYSEAMTDASVTTPDRLGREQFPSRRYQAQGHFLVLDGPGHIIDQDAEDICKNPNWRLATAAEQNQFTAQKRKAARLEEAAAPPAPLAPEPAAVPDPAPEAPANEPQPEAPAAPAAGKVLTTDTAPQAAGKDK